MRIIDLSHELVPSFVEDKLKLSAVDMTSIFCYVFNPDPTCPEIAHFFSTSSHVGTHLESPYHWGKAGRDVASLPLDSLIGPVIKLDLSHREKAEAITVEDVERISNGRLKTNDMVFLQTNHSKMWGTEEYWFDSPYLSKEAAEWLVKKGVKLVGIDGPRLDCYRFHGRMRYINHEIVHGNGVPVIENLANLSEFGDRGTAFVLPLKIRGMDAFPVRVIVVEGVS